MFYGTDGPPLPFPTVFNNRWWWSDILGPLPLGGVVPKPRGYNGLWKVPGLVFGHYCGTPEMFMEGYDPVRNPPTPPDFVGQVIPPCCPSPLGGRVAAAARPSSVFKEWSGPTYPTSGGYQLGGPYPPTSVPVSPVAGGYQLGGSVRAVVGPVFAPTGGYQLGGEVEGELAGNLLIQNETGGPFPFAGNITMIGTPEIVLVPGANNVTVTLAAIGPAPGQPTGVTATPGNQSVSVSWTAPSGIPPDGYVVFYAPTSTYPAGLLSQDFGNALTGTITGLTNGIAYTTIVSAYFKKLAGQASATAATTPSTALASDDLASNLRALNGRALQAGTTTPQNWANTDNTLTVTASGTGPSGTGGVAIGFVNAGTGNVVVSVTITDPGVHTWAFGVMARQVDNNNYWTWQYDSVDGNLFLSEVTAGVGTNRVTVPYTWGSGASHTLKLVCSGSVLNVYVDGVQVGTYGSTDFQTAVGVGIRAYRDTASYPTEAFATNFTCFAV